MWIFLARTFFRGKIGVVDKSAGHGSRKSEYAGLSERGE